MPFPTDLPTKIVPSVAVAAAQPVDTTLISILFSDALSWTWMVSNGNASAQVFAYTPATIATALGIPTSSVQTVSLQAYQPATYNGDANSILTVYLAYIPTSYVDALQAMLKSPNSPLYQQSGVQSQIAQMMNPNFSVLAYSGSNSSGGGDPSSLNTTGGTTSSASGPSSRTIIIAVVVSFGVLMLALATYAAFRATKRGAIALPRGGREPRQRENLRSFQLGHSPNGHNSLARSNSVSTTSSASSGSTGYSGPSRTHQRGTSQSTGPGAGGDSNSWWRFSTSENGHGGHGEMSERQYGQARENRRITVVRGPDGNFDSGIIGRYVHPLPLV